MVQHLTHQFDNKIANVQVEFKKQIDGAKNIKKLSAHMQKLSTSVKEKSNEIYKHQKEANDTMMCIQTLETAFLNSTASTTKIIQWTVANTMKDIFAQIKESSSSSIPDKKR